MPRSRDEWIGRIKEVEREHNAVRLAVDTFLIAASRDPTFGTGSSTLRDVRLASDYLDGTYLIRLFAEFETAIRLFWKTIRDNHPPMKDLIESITARRNISASLSATLHQVREYRNSLVHERDDATDPITIADGRRAFCTFLSFLPRTW